MFQLNIHLTLVDGHCTDQEMCLRPEQHDELRLLDPSLYV